MKLLSSPQLTKAKPDEHENPKVNSLHLQVIVQIDFFK